MSAQLVALGAGLLVSVGVFALSLAFSPPAARPRSAPLDGRRPVWAIVVGLAVLLLTRWPVAAAGAGLLVVGWPWLFVSSAQAAAERERLTALARWLEDLRDTLRRSSVAVERALEMVAGDTVGPLRGPLDRFVLRRRQGMRIPEALAEFADSVAHPTGDAAVSALILVVDGAAGGARLYDTLDELAGAARDELRARTEIDRLRRIYQRSMRRLVVMTVVFVGGLVVFAQDLLAPYRSVAGQIWLLVPLAMWVGCLVWLRQLTSYADEPRYRFRLAQAVES